MPIACPFCRMQVEDSAELSGQVVNCPGCRRAFKMPSEVSIVAPQAVQSVRPVAHTQHAPVFLVNTAPPVRPRLHSGGWFARSFLSAAGVLVAIVLISATVCAGIYSYGKSSINKLVKEHDKRNDVAVRQAKKALAAHGFSGEVSSDSQLKLSLDPGCTDAVEGGVMTDQGVKQFTVHFHVATFNDKQVWTPRAVMVDGEVVFSKY